MRGNKPENEQKRDLNPKSDHANIYSVISIILILQLLGLFAFLHQAMGNAKPLLEIKVEQVKEPIKTETEKQDNQRTTEKIPDKIDKCLAKYTTKFDPNQLERVANIELAAKLIKNVVIAPGELFSYNRTVGERTKEAGFKVAPVIVNKKVSLGLGGGICQVSSTLYSAVLDSKIKVVERHPHSIPVKYVPRGRDATVVYGSLDFQFENNLKNYIIIKTELEYNKLTVKIFTLK